MNSGSDAASSTSTLSRLASSLPSTSSLLVRFVSSSSTSVRRSFSWATPLAASRAEKKIASANCKRGQNLKQHRAEAGHVAHVAHDLRAGQHQPGRAHQHQQGRDVGRARQIQPPAARRGHKLTSEDWPNQQTAALVSSSCSRTRRAVAIESPAIARCPDTRMNR